MSACVSPIGIDILNSSGYLPHIIYHLVRYKFVTGFLKPDDAVLDIACGTGYGSRMLSDFCGYVTGIDVNIDAVNYAAKNYGGKNREFYQGDVLKIRGQYDVIVSFETIEHISQEEGFLALGNLKECLKPGGILFMSTPKKLPEEELSEGRLKYHKHEYSYDEFKKLLGTFFSRPVIFSQTDEIISMGNSKAVWTYIAMCWNG